MSRASYANDDHRLSSEMDSYLHEYGSAIPTVSKIVVLLGAEINSAGDTRGKPTRLPRVKRWNSGTFSLSR